MHSHHYDSNIDDLFWIGQEGWAFHVNGDPFGGDCLINPRGKGWKPDWPTFRTTMNELATYIMADILKTVPENGLQLATTHFVRYETTYVKMSVYEPQETDDAIELIVPYDILSQFVNDMIHERFVSYADGQRNMAGMAAIGAYVMLTQGNKND